MGSFKNYITSFWKGLLSLLKGMWVTGIENPQAKQKNKNKKKRQKKTAQVHCVRYLSDELPEWDNQNRGFENYHRRW